MAGSTHGGALVPVRDSSTGLPVMLPVTWTADAQQSPAIDRGDAADSFGNEPLPNGGYINLGAYGNTAQASQSPAEYLMVTRPDGGEVWPAQQTFAVRWRSHEPGVGQVNLDLMQDGNPDPVWPIAVNIPNNGEFSWTIPAAISSASDYRVRVTRTDVSMPPDTSNAPFTIAASAHFFYVNDAAVDASCDWTTAAGR